MLLKRSDFGNILHLSHLYEYVSAYAISKDEVIRLAEEINKALVIAEKLTKTQIVHLDGEHCFHITPTGYIVLMIPWKTYKVFNYKSNESQELKDFGLRCDDIDENVV